MDPPPPPMTTSSTCTVSASKGTHLFHIAGFSHHERLGAGNSVRSAAFSVGGLDWAVRLFPDVAVGEDRRPMVLLLELLTPNAAARASCQFRFLNQATGDSSSVWSVWSMTYTAGSADDRAAEVSTLSPILAPLYAQDDVLTVECAITVVSEPKVSETRAVSVFQEPPSDLAAHLGRLLLLSLEEDDDGSDVSDVSFRVQGEVICAHRIVLAMRSPAFKAKFYGPEDELDKSLNLGCVDVEDVRPDVFKAMLRFVYTDSLPDVDADLGDDGEREMMRQLLVAADRYEMKRLKLMCEDSLCKSLGVDSVATTLAFAELHGLCILKDACLEFIAFSDKIDDVVASQGYAHLKRSCPSVLLEVLERSSKFPRA